MRTFGTPDARLLTHIAHPFIRAGGGVTRLARLAALEATRIDVLATAKQRTEQADLRLRRRPAIDQWFRFHRGISHIRACRQAVQVLPWRASMQSLHIRCASHPLTGISAHRIRRIVKRSPSSISTGSVPLCSFIHLTIFLGTPIPECSR